VDKHHHDNMQIQQTVISLHRLIGWNCD